MLENLNILLGVSGGIAAYKAVDLASKLKARGANISTVMTESACRLIGPKSFEAVTQSAVYTTMWSAPDDYEISHIALVDSADVVVVAPATANIIGKIANGICDDLLSTVLPAMNDQMWANPVVQDNIETVKKLGFQLVGPVKGRLACGTEGPGRMAEPQDIVEAIEKIASSCRGRPALERGLEARDTTSKTNKRDS
jgi:phosphopantothenoylcysteine decarboxylase/phosphopantothenate--cysteine ligase